MEKNPLCPCKKEECERHGDCDQCKPFHHSQNGLTICEVLKRKGKK